MLLAVAATEIEMAPYLSMCPPEAGGLLSCISGVGPVEAAISMTRTLEKYHTMLAGVVNFGTAGAYLSDGEEIGAGVLDTCLADKEVFGDYGVCIGDRIEPFANTTMSGVIEFELDKVLFDRAQQILAAHELAYAAGTFVTVNAASGTAARGNQLRSRYRALCENMEGAAVARVCREFSVPMIEIRVVSNLVEDRPTSSWKLTEASHKSACAASLIIQGLQESL
ncbi:MAG: futalosine hydrolase [Desulfobacterales bacterium]|nr:futalosine hydrolase [Deltaproteobacteria bacterium]MBT8362876.1 futalosine hydrolase [Deltaproteobacteria bacterium]NNK93078.1 futalosine hydrolase [Desulfobacterales bacterium]